MRYLSTVYVTDHQARIGVKGQALEIRRERALVARFPLHGTDTVVLASAASMSTEAIGRCTRHGIRVASLHRSGTVRYIVSGGTSGNVLVRVAQYRMADNHESTMHLARHVVAGKLQNARRALIRWADAAPGPERQHINQQRTIVEDRLTALWTTRNLDHVRGLEGDSSRRYFKGMGAHLARTAPNLPFINRTRRPPRDPVNAVLGYCYGLLQVSCQGALEAVGLDPQVGFLHGLRPGRASLALDLMEELRPAMADRFVVTTISRRQLGPEHFQVGPAGACYLTDDGRTALLRLYEEFKSQDIQHPLLRQTVPRSALPTIQATILARHIRGDLPTYAPFIG